ncbi:ubiquitin-conjugating enzyme E2 K-like [Arvicola amphibius]|uniref:ubiquitin-conjugating enzyme E2 K-like n=1 Tax=Arvicola amphibius TaxID=1047088 RepID=UPI001C080B3F|nr:ubiquitin-conjugating enzyme E2 K-like [Arvicola amphibius]
MEESCPSQKSSREGKVGTGRRKKDGPRERMGRHLTLGHQQIFSGNTVVMSFHIFELRVEIAGPPDSPYEGGRYQLEIKIPETYPFKPTKVRFITKIWHPNISSVTGAICLDILKDQWAAAMTLCTVLLSLQALLAAAEPDDPQDAVVANQYKQNPEMFKQAARLWAHVYAGAPVSSPEYERKKENLCAMGFDRNAVIVALSSKSWAVETASE